MSYALYRQWLLHLRDSELNEELLKVLFKKTSCTNANARRAWGAMEATVKAEMRRRDATKCPQ